MAGEWIVFMAACFTRWKNACAMAFGTATSRPALAPALWAAWSVVCFFAAVVMFATHSLAVAGVTGVITVVFTFTLMQAAISVYKNATRNWKTRRKKPMNRNKSCRQYGL